MHGPLNVKIQNDPYKANRRVRIQASKIGCLLNGYAVTKHNSVSFFFFDVIF